MIDIKFITDNFEETKKRLASRNTKLVESAQKVFDLQTEYKKALQEGDKNVYFVPTPQSLAPIGNDGTVDGCHPNDLGFYCMYRKVLPVLKKALGL